MGCGLWDGFCERDGGLDLNKGMGGEFDIEMKYSAGPSNARFLAESISI